MEALSYAYGGLLLITQTKSRSQSQPAQSQQRELLNTTPDVFPHQRGGGDLIDSSQTPHALILTTESEHEEAAASAPNFRRGIATNDGTSDVTIEMARGGASESTSKQPASRAKPGRKRGRPRKLTSIHLQEIVSMLSRGFSFRRAAIHAGCSPGTVLNEMRRDPNFAKLVRNSRQLAERCARDCIVQASKKSWRAAAFLLAQIQLQKRLDAELEAEVDQIQIEQEPHADVILSWELDSTNNRKKKSEQG